MSRNQAVNKPLKRPKLSNDGVPGRLRYFMGRAFLNIRQNLFVNVVTVATITLALLIISLFLLVFINVESIADDWSKRVQITTYFDRELMPQEVMELTGKINQLEGTERVTYISREEAMKRFRSRLKGQESLLDGVTADVLPASFEIVLKRQHRSGEAMDNYAARLKKIQGVTEVQYGAEWVRRFSTFMNFMRLVGLVLGGFLTIAVVFIVSNTIKLTIYARKEELEVLSLVGATRFFIKAPFLIEGIIQGAVGAVLAIILLAVSYLGFLYNTGNFLSFGASNTGLSFLSPGHIGVLFLTGIGLGFIGSLSSLKRFVTF